MSVTTGQDLLNAHLLLADLHMADPILAIQDAVAWLCPSYGFETLESAYEWSDYQGDSDSPLLNALLTCRRLFPEVYQEALSAIETGAKLDDVEVIVLNGVNLHIEYTDVWSLDEMAYGIPLEGLGADWSQEEWWEDHSEEADLLHELNIDSRDAVKWENQRSLIKVALVLAGSLLGGEIPDPPEYYSDPSPRERVGWLILWLFQTTGIDMADWGYLSLDETGYNRPQWTQVDLDMVNDLMSDAVRAVKTAQAGLDLIGADKAWHDALVRNFKKVERKLHNGQVPTQRSCCWPDDPQRHRPGHAKRSA